ncbi:MAG: ribosomal protein S18-alanine N-acetyltransferase [Beijerinckiaceae bacterium]|nr:ribosomal protein S18-alanine N-acetyltransferase [Beijerinckiaceae bacterium]MBX9759646.1 ribosomal protein S18-alanine N-acetyltransferase [Beijerinckiaceae bacterium]MDO9441908.1 ribosomal protein S18-alanine N-acetyltransferase [Beijerinckiaceae bacterium]
MRWPFGGQRLDPTTRRFEARWARECARIHAASFASPWSPDGIAQMAAGGDIVADVALDGPGARLLGFAISRTVPPEGEILTIAVDAAFRRHGVGGILLREHLARIAAKGVKTLFLEVDEGNAPALKLYRRFGFQQVGVRAGYYAKKDGSRATALVMRADLD